MTEELLAPGIWAVSEGSARLFYGVCDEGCWWMLSPDYRTVSWVAQHGDNPEAMLVFDRTVEPFDPAAMWATIEDWLLRCHAYEEHP